MAPSKPKMRAFTEAESSARGSIRRDAARKNAPLIKLIFNAIFRVGLPVGRTNPAPVVAVDPSTDPRSALMMLMMITMDRSLMQSSWLVFNITRNERRVREDAFPRPHRHRTSGLVCALN